MLKDKAFRVYSLKRVSIKTQIQGLRNSYNNTGHTLNIKQNTEGPRNCSLVLWHILISTENTRPALTELHHTLCTVQRLRHGGAPQ